MKYRMQYDPETDHWSLVRVNLPDGGEVVFQNRGVEETHYPIAAVEFWQELEQLGASQAELVSALKATTLSLKAAIAGASIRGADEIVVCAEAAIVRAERKDGGE